ncbi:4-coumarate--CoA ligase 1-like [Ixodes scapularis]
MEAVVEEKEVRSKTQDVDIPDVHLGQYFRSICERFKDRTALIDGITDERWSYAQLLELSSRVAAGLQKLGFGPGQLAGLHCEVTPDIVFAFYGTILTGGSIVFAKSSLTERELTYQFGDSRPSLVFCDEANADKTKSACATISSVETLVIFGERENMVSFAMLKNTPLCELQSVPSGDPKQLLALIYSSGTTGFPKGVMLSSKNIVANACIISDPRHRSLDGNDIVLGTAPLTHVSGLTMFNVSIAVGACMVLLPGSEPSITLPAIDKYKATVMFQFPTYIQKLVKSPLLEKYDVSSVRILYCGGSSMPSVVVRAVRTKLNIKALRQGYGLTETCGTVSLTPFNSEDAESIGKPLAMTRMKVVDVNTGLKLGPCEHGEIRVKGPTCVSGYLNNPEATAKLYDSEGFLHTGDIGYYTEEGMFYVVDRMKEMIKCMDQQVAPAELEDLLLKHEDVKEVAVAGVPHAEYGEAARAFVVLSNGHSGSEALKTRLFKLVADQSAPHKHLHGGLEFVSSIPKSETGKNLRRALRDTFVKKHVQGRI